MTGGTSCGGKREKTWIVRIPIGVAQSDGANYQELKAHLHEKRGSYWGGEETLSQRGTV